MRNFLSGLALCLVSANVAFSACNDTTLVITNGAAGYDNLNANYNPAAAGAINDVITGCTDNVMTIRLQYSNPGKKDTLYLSGPIKVTGRDNKITALIAKGTADSMVTFVETTADPSLLIIDPLNATSITKFGFARKALNSNNPSLMIKAKGTTVHGCHFWMDDNTSIATAVSLIEIQSDSVLVEQSLFRTKVDGAGRSNAIHSTAGADRVEIRSNIFASTGVLIEAGSNHIYANSFVGSRNSYNCIRIGYDVSASMGNISIQHNLFAPKPDTIAPIAFKSGSAAAS